MIGFKTHVLAYQGHFVAGGCVCIRLLSLRL